MIEERIRDLREKGHMTQTALAKKLGITRSSVNAWEMGISVPSTQYLVELSYIFDVSTDYLLGLDRTATLGVEGLTEADIQLLHQVIDHLKSKNAP